jgi:hypothetical protein
MAAYKCAGCELVVLKSGERYSFIIPRASFPEKLGEQKVLEEACLTETCPICREKITIVKAE